MKKYKSISFLLVAVAALVTSPVGVRAQDHDTPGVISEAPKYKAQSIVLKAVEVANDAVVLADLTKSVIEMPAAQKSKGYGVLGIGSGVKILANIIARPPPIGSKLHMRSI